MCVFAPKVGKLILVGDLETPLFRKAALLSVPEYLRRMINLTPIGGWLQRRLGLLGMDT